MTGTTIYDNREVESILYDALQQTGLFVERSTVVGMMGWSKLKVFETLWEQQIGKSHAMYRQNVTDSYDLFTQLLEQHYASQRIRAADGATELFWHCRKNGIKVALTTGLYRKVTNIILQRLDWMKGLDEHYTSQSPFSVIDCSISSTEVQSGRPCPDMIRLAMQQLGVTDPMQVINIGDTPADLLSGRNAGVRLSLGVSNGTYSASELQHYPHDGILGSTGELIMLLENIV
ncbi:HAD hydrolase-like protein [Paraflavitalea sp. CAU 1676]|nr:HAD hydrolase-like protein [Paraflavitalea sp. CAU 1676]MDF2193499.1 HAD hydrolase-like protein [Paraflavitalea sp. CAU 1676]